MSDDRAPSASPEAYVLLAAGGAGYFLFLFVWFLLPAFLTPIIAELGLSSTQAGVVAGAVQLVYVPLALASGLVVDRIGAANAIGAGLVILGGAGALRSLAGGFPALFAATLLLGVGGTGITFGLPKLVAELFPPRRTGTASSVYLVGASLGTAAAFALGRQFLGPAVGGWRPLFRLSGLAVLVAGVVWLALARPLRRRATRFDADEPAPSLRSDLRTVLVHPQLRLLVVVGTMQLFLSHGLQAWLATALETRGLAAGLAASVASLFVLARILGTLGVPALSDRYSARRAALVGCGALAAVGTLGVMASGTDPTLLVAVVGLVGVGVGGIAPLVRAIPVELDGIGPGLTATATGLIFSVGEIGGFAGPFLIGGARDLTGSFLPGFGALAVGSVVVVAAGYAMEEPSAGRDARTDPAGTGPDVD
jgi:cyanate permease